MCHLKTKERGRMVSWQWPSVRMSEHIVTNFLRMVRITWEKLGDVGCLRQVDYVAIELVFL